MSAQRILGTRKDDQHLLADSMDLSYLGRRARRERHSCGAVPLKYWRRGVAYWHDLKRPEEQPPTTTTFVVR